MLPIQYYLVVDSTSVISTWKYINCLLKMGISFTYDTQVPLKR